MTEIVKADENLFLSLGFPPHEVEILQLRADLMGQLRLWIQDPPCRCGRLLTVFPVAGPRRRLVAPGPGC
jgi:hypothetical protein